MVLALVRRFTRQVQTSGWADIFALVALMLMGIAIFHVHLMAGGTFIGDSDRLNTFLNIRKFEVDGIQHHRPLVWDELMFMGFDTSGLHYMLVGMDPTAYFEALLPIQDLFRVAGYVSSALLILAGWSAYLFIKDTCRHSFSAFVGAALYSFSTFSIVRISQVDSAFAVMVLIPLGLLVLRTLRPGNVALSFVVLTLLLTSLFLFTFLQEVAYAILLFGAYAVYRGLRFRRWHPPIIFLGALLVAVVISFPRLFTVLRDFQLLDRTTTFQTTCWCEIFRWSNDGIFGRFPGEQSSIGNGINLHEGFQLYTSTFAALLVLAGAMRFRGALGSGATVTFLSILGLTFVPWIGLRTSIGLALAMVVLSNILARFESHPYAASTALSGDQERDASFHLYFLALAFAIILIEPVRYVLYIAFLRVDFTHSRISGAAVLPMCTLASVFIRDMFGTSEERVQNRTWVMTLLGSGLVAISVLWVIEVLAVGGLTGKLGFARPIHLGGWILMLPAELMKIVWGTVFFAAFLVGIWASRNAEQTRRVLVCSLGFAMVFQVFAYANFQLNGPQTWTFPIAFLDNNFLNVQPAVFRPPTSQTLKAFHQRLETDQYRSVLIANPMAFPAFPAPHLAQFWRLRLVEGYGAGVPRRLAKLPWPEGVRTLRALSFSDTAHLPWSLLAVLNVKYAVVVNPALYYNLSPGGTRIRSEARPQDVEILQNPLPAVSRHFFVKKVLPAPRTSPSASAKYNPLPPVGINATVVSSSAIVLSWMDVTSDARYRIERKDGVNGVYTEVALTGPNAQSHYNAGLKPGTGYYFRMRACTAGRCSPYSAGVIAVTANGIQETPTNLKAAAVARDAIVLTWRGVAQDAWCRIERKAGVNGTYNEVGITDCNAQSYVMSSLASLTTYHFRVRSCTANGCSSHSAEASAATPSALEPSELRDIVPSNPVKESIVEGFPAPAQFSTEGKIEVNYTGARIDIHVDSSDWPRFLVLNELYHPGWEAFAGSTELKIYPTNVVMRGLIVPPKTTEIQLRLISFPFTPFAALYLGAGAVSLLAGWWLLRRFEVKA